MTRLADEAALELCREEEEERLISEANNKAWLEREQVAQFEFAKKRQIQEENERRIQEEKQKALRAFEEAEERKKLLREQKLKVEAEIRRNHQRKLQEIKDFLDGLLPDVPESLLGTTETNPTAEECPYFKKTSVCRFGDRCSKNHIKAKLSSILLIPNFFRTENFLRGPSLTHSDDIIRNSLDVNRDFNEFFEDICDEFEKFGAMKNVLVCTNTEKHMIGNVFVEYTEAKNALGAAYHLNGRFYGGFKLAIDFCHNVNWRTAVCGMYNAEEWRRRHG